MKRNVTILALALVMATTSILFAQSQQEGSVQPVSEKNSRKVPARLIPVPNTVSPELQAVIARPLSSALRLVPRTLCMTQNDMAHLFQSSADNISLNLKNIYS